MTPKKSLLNKIILFLCSFLFFALINIAYAIPVASITAPEIILTGDSASLSAQSSTGNQLKYRWKLVGKPEGSTSQLINSTLSDTSFTVDREGVYLAELRVLEGSVWSSPQYKTISALASVGEVVLAPEVFEASFFCKISFGLVDCEEAVRDFDIASPSGNFSLVIENAGVKKAFISLNGVDLTDYYQLSGGNEIAVKKTQLLAHNQLKLRFGQPGSYGEFNSQLKIKIVRNLLPTGQNPAPVASALPIKYYGSLGGKTQLTITDANQTSGHILSVLVPAKNGEVSISPTGLITYEPDYFFLGDDEVVILVKDTGFPQKAQAVVIPIQLLDGNEPPLLSSTLAEISNGQTITGKIQVRDTAGQTHVFAITEAATHGVATIDSDGNVTYTPQNNFLGLDTFKIRVTDSGSPSAYSDIIIPVDVLENHPPIVSSPALTMEQGMTETVQFTFSDVDPGQETSISLKSMPAHGMATMSADGNLVYTPDPFFYGQELIEVSVKDNGHPAQESIMTLLVDVLENKPPTIAFGVGQLTVSPGFSHIIPYSVDDLNRYQTYTVSVPEQPAHGTATIENNSLVYTPALNYFGSDDVTVVVTDNGFPAKQGFATLHITIEENHPPAPSFVGDTITAGKERSFTFYPNDPDVGQEHTYSISAFPEHGILIPSPDWNNTISYKPNLGFIGNDQFKVVVTDNGAPIMATEIVVNMTIRANSAPVIFAAYPMKVAQASAGSSYVDVRDGDGDDVTLRVVGNATLGTAKATGGGYISFVADKGLSGSEYLTIEARDNGEPSLTTTAQMLVEVDANHAPAPINQTLIVGVDERLSIYIPSADPDEQQVITYTIISPVTHGTLSDNGSGSYMYVGNTNYVGADEFTVRLTDNGTPALSKDVKISISIQQNFPPAPIATDLITLEGTIGYISINPNDPNPSQSVKITIIAYPEHGVLLSEGTLNPAYVPNPGFVGQDQFIVRLTDNGIPNLSTDLVIPIEVERNLPPNPLANAATIFQNTSVQIDVLPNDPNHAIQYFTYEVSTLPKNGSVSANSSSFLYTPAWEFSGQDTFVVKVTDSGNPKLSGYKTVVVNVVKNVNPTVIANNITTFQSTAASMQVNYTDVEPDQSHTYLIISSPLHGFIDLSQTGLLTYTPYSGYTGSDTIVVGVQDSARPNGLGTKTIQVTVVPNAIPTVIANNISTFQSTTATTQVSYTDVEPDQTHTYLILTNPTHGTATLNAQGLLTYVPGTGYSGPDKVVVGVRDSAIPNATGTKDILITVVPNSIPTVIASDFTTFQSTKATAQVSYSDFDIGQTHVYSIQTNPVNGVATISTQGLLTYTPTSGYSGSDSLVVAVTDNAVPAGVGVKNITITVTPNTIPTVIASNMKIFQGSQGTTQVTYTDPDVGQTHAYTISTPPLYGTATVTADGLTTYTSTDICNRTEDTFKVKVSDSATPKGSASKTIHVTFTNDTLPTIAVTNLSINQRDTATTQITATDPDAGQVLTYGIKTPPLHGVASVNAAGLVTYQNNSPVSTPNTDTFEIFVNDGFGACSGQLNSKAIGVTIAPNHAPTIAGNNITVEQAGVVNGTLTKTDADQFQTLEFIVSTNPAHGTVTLNSVTGEYTYSSASTYSGADQFQILVRDNGLPQLSATKTIGVTVVPLNFPPVPTANIMALLSGKSSTTTIHPNDPDVSQVHTYQLMAPAQFGSATVSSLGVVNYQAYVGAEGQEILQVKVTDNGVFPRSAIVSIPVEVVKNLAPNPINQLSSMTSGETAQFIVLANDPNEARFPQTYSFRISTAPAVGTATVDTLGNVTYVAPVSYSGIAEFDVEVSDQGTPSLSGHSHIKVTIVANQAPVVATKTLNTIKNVSVTQQVAFTDTDSATQTFTYAIAQAPTHGVVAVGLDGQLTYTPQANYVGNDQLTVRVTDSGHPALSGQAVYSVVVGSSNNTPPTLSSIAAYTKSDGFPKKYEFDLLDLADSEGSVKEVQVNFGDNTELLVLNENTPVIISGEFALDYFEHNYRQAGTYNVTVTLIDNENAQAQFHTTLTIGNNHPPIARVNFTPYQGSTPLNLVADASASTDSDGTISAFCLRVKKGSAKIFSQCTSSGTQLSYQVATAGIYQARGCVYDNGGAYNCFEQNIYAGVDVPGPGVFNAFAVIDASQRLGSAPLNNVTLNGSRSRGFNNANIVEYQWAIHGRVSNNNGQEINQYYSGVNQVVNLQYAGVYDVSLMVVDENGNQGISKTEIVVEDSAVDDLSIYALYYGDNNFHFKMNTSGLSFSGSQVFWDLGDGEVQQGFEADTNLASGVVHQIKLEAYDVNGKKHVVTKSIDLTVTPTAPHISLQNIPQQVQVNQNFTLNASGSDDPNAPLRFRWWLGDGSPTINGVGLDYAQISHAFSTLGEKTIILSVSNRQGLSSEMVMKINVISGQAPTLAATVAPISGLSPLLVNAQVQGFDPDGVILSYTWNFDGFNNGRVRTGQNISNIYYKTGSYGVSVTALDSDGNKVTQYVDTVNVGTFNKAPVVANETISTKKNKKLTHDIEFSDDDVESQLHTYSIVSAPTHGSATISSKGRLTYQPATDYLGSDTLRVRVTDGSTVPAYGEGTITIQVTGDVNQNPVIAGVEYNYETSSFPRATYIYFDDISDPDGEITKVTWDFGDNTTPLVIESNQLDGYDEVIHQYVQAGTYNVVITAEDNQGGITTATKTIVHSANQMPTAAFAVTATGTGPYQINLDATTAIDPDGTIDLYCWNIERGGTRIYHKCNTTPTQTVSLPSAGEVTVSLYVEDNLLGSSYYETDFNIDAANSFPPYVAFDTSGSRKGAAPFSIQWGSQSTIAFQNKTIVKKYWQISDTQLNDAFNEGNTITADYLFPGTHVTHLDAIDSDGKRNSFEQLVYVGQNIPLKADFTMKAEDSQSISFDAANWTHGHYSGFFLWDFGDGSHEFDRYASHTYNRSGKYKVGLTVLDIYGNLDFHEEVIVVGGDLPTAAASGNYKLLAQLNSPLSLEVTGNSSDIVRWSFGDGTYDQGQISQKGSLTHSYTQKGVYRLLSTVTNTSTGLSQDFYKIVNVVDNTINPQVEIVASQSTGPAPLNVNFSTTHAAAYVPASYRWAIKNDRGEIVFMSTLSSTSFNFTKGGNYNVDVFTKDAAGNRDYFNYGIFVTDSFNKVKRVKPKFYMKKRSARDLHRLKLLELLHVRKS